MRAATLPLLGLALLALFAQPAQTSKALDLDADEEPTEPATAPDFTIPVKIHGKEVRIPHTQAAVLYLFCLGYCLFLPQATVRLTPIVITNVHRLSAASGRVKIPQTWPLNSARDMS